MVPCADLYLKGGYATPFRCVPAPHHQLREMKSKKTKRARRTSKPKTASQVTNHAHHIPDSIFPLPQPSPSTPPETQRITRPRPAPLLWAAPRSSCCPAARRLPTRREPRSSTDLMPRRGSCTGRPQPRACRPRPSAPGSAAAPAPPSRSAWARTRWQVRK